MGVEQSRPTSRRNSPLTFDDKEKQEFLNLLFTRLLETGDIVDLKALTSGPGACGNYVVLLSKNINKEFKRLKLSEENDLGDLTYSTVKNITKKSSSRESMCTQLALFYIRLLQLVSAVSVSLYAPPDLISRILEGRYKRDLNIKKISYKAVENPSEMEIKKRTRNEWFETNFLTSTSNIGEIYTFAKRRELVYNKLRSSLTYTSSEGNVYTVNLAVLEPDYYPISRSLIKLNTYWIVLSRQSSSEIGDPIYYRVLVDSAGTACLFDIPLDPPIQPNNVLEKLTEERCNEPLDNWLKTMKIMLINLVEPSRTRGFLPQMAAFANVTNTRRNVTNTRRNVARNNSNRTLKNANIFKFPIDNTLPPRDKDTYIKMLQWIKSIKLSDWPEAAPAVYRASLLYKKPIINTEIGTSYSCNDIWVGKQLSDLHCFASLQNLFYNNENGLLEEDIVNKTRLSELSKDFFDIYINIHEANSPIKKDAMTIARMRDEIIDFRQLKIPDTSFIQNILCDTTTALGESRIRREMADILNTAQEIITDNYKEHVTEMHRVLSNMFETVIEGGETVIKFKEAFLNVQGGLRHGLEERVEYLRDLISNHYKLVEQTYYTALINISNIARP